MRPYNTNGATTKTSKVCRMFTLTTLADPQ